MNRRLWLVIAAIVVIAGVWFFMRSGEGRPVVDLMAEFPKAKDKRPVPDLFSVADATIGGVTKPAILADAAKVNAPGSRLVYNLTVPNDAWLRVSIGMLEQGWTTPGDGVLFRVLVSVSGQTEELLSYVCNPYVNGSDRRWHEMMLDLSPYAGENVDLAFNTNSSPPSPPGKDDRAGDLPVWGNPQIVVR
jgi:hypothetical protein